MRETSRTGLWRGAGGNPAPTRHRTAAKPRSFDARHSLDAGFAASARFRRRSVILIVRHYWSEIASQHCGSTRRGRTGGAQIFDISFQLALIPTAELVCIRMVGALPLWVRQKPWVVTIPWILASAIGLLYAVRECGLSLSKRRSAGGLCVLAVMLHLGLLFLLGVGAF